MADCCVIGRAHHTAGEVPWALVVLKSPKSGNQKLKESIMDYIKERKIRYKHLAGLEFVPRIHKSVSGKILRRKSTSFK